jgi:excisionase family DNA binding protein
MSVERLLSRNEAAHLLGVPAKSLAAWAYTGRGPAYYRVGKHSRYRMADLEQWLAEQRVEGRR